MKHAGGRLDQRAGFCRHEFSANLIIGISAAAHSIRSSPRRQNQFIRYLETQSADNFFLIRQPMVFSKQFLEKIKEIIHGLRGIGEVLQLLQGFFNFHGQMDTGGLLHPDKPFIFHGHASPFL